MADLEKEMYQIHLRYLNVLLNIYVWFTEKMCMIYLKMCVLAGRLEDPERAVGTKNPF